MSGVEQEAIEILCDLDFATGVFLRRRDLSDGLVEALAREYWRRDTAKKVIGYDTATVDDYVAMIREEHEGVTR